MADRTDTTPPPRSPAHRLPAGSSTPEVHDVLVIGGGPGGSSCAYWLACAGWDVAVVEKKRFPREKTCGDGLTPRAVRQLADMGLEPALAGSHRYDGLRAHGFGQVVEMGWPAHPGFPSYGYTITRHDLDGIVANHAAAAGATVWQGTEAVEPIIAASSGSLSAGSAGTPIPSGRDPATGLASCVGAVVRDRDRTREIHARCVVVADGSNSRFGRALGTNRRRERPLGMALRGYYRSPLHDDPYIESHLDIRTSDGEVVPGYGWIFPLGDGRVNVGVGLLSTDRRWKGVNTSKLMDVFVEWAPKRWGLSPSSSCGPPTGGKLPMGLSVGPHAGPTTLVIGDAGGAINPFNGEGIAYAYETGRLAAAAVGQSLSGGGAGALLDFERQLADAYGSYYRVARAFVRLISNPAIMRTCVGVGLHSDRLMNELLRIMANLMRPGPAGPAEIGYRGMDLVGRLLGDGGDGGDGGWYRDRALPGT